MTTEAAANPIPNPDIKDMRSPSVELMPIEPSRPRLVNREKTVLRWFITGGMLALSPLAANAQAPDTLMVPMTGQERALVLTMCDNAAWANKRSFESVCEFFKIKFETVAKAAAAQAKPAEPKPAEAEPTKPKE